jgi:hypothetical protein
MKPSVENLKGEDHEGELSIHSDENVTGIAYDIVD